MKFGKLLVEYEKAPQVTRQRLYLDTIEEVLAGNPKVMLDNKGGNSLMYLPIDKLIERSSDRESQSATTELQLDTPLAAPVTPEGASRDRTDNRMRGGAR